jgi:hypothetical protein
MENYVTNIEVYCDLYEVFNPQTTLSLSARIATKEITWIQNKRPAIPACANPTARKS